MQPLHPAYLFGVNILHHSGGQIGRNTGQTVGPTQNRVAAENMGPAVLTAQDGPLGESGQTVKAGRTCCADNSVSQNLVVKGNINTVVIAVEGNRFHIDIGVQKLCAADPDTGTGIQNCLRTGG